MYSYCIILDTGIHYCSLIFHTPESTCGSVVAGENVLFLVMLACHGTLSSATTLPQIHVAVF